MHWWLQTKHLCVLIHIWTKAEVGAPWNWFKPWSKIFLLTIPRWCLFCGSFMLFLPGFCYAFVCVYLLMPCGHMLGKCWPLGSRLWCLIVKLSLSHWYPESGVVLDCIDSWYALFVTLVKLCKQQEEDIFHMLLYCLLLTATRLVSFEVLRDFVKYHIEDETWKNSFSAKDLVQLIIDSKKISLLLTTVTLYLK